MKSLTSAILAIIIAIALLNSVDAYGAQEAQAEAVNIAKPGISVKVSGSSVTVTIKKNADAEGYLIYGKAEGDKEFTCLGMLEKDGSKKRKYTVDSLPDGTYYIKVKAYRGTIASNFSKAKKIVVNTKLSLWTDDAPLKKELINYLAAITDEKNPDYIPVENRIAVFDLDGTLFCETDPNYFDYTLLVYRVLEDPDYKDKASDFERETAEKIVTLNETGVAAKGLEVDHGKAVASAFAGMTLDEFNSYIQKFKELPMPGYEGMKRGEGWYKPMLQVVELLKENDFTVYIVSGTDRFIVRGIAYNAPVGIPNTQIIGSDERLVATNQNGADGLEYVFTENDKVILAGEFIIKNLKMNKVTVIAQEIGIQPVLSFGNSTGDSSMAEYVICNNPYKSKAFMLCCDDLERENGNIEKADKMYSLCEEFGWTPVSMKNDWLTIYGDGVVRKQQKEAKKAA